MTSSLTPPPWDALGTSRQSTGRFGRYAGMAEEIAAIQATATSADRAVTVVAGPSGAVLDVRLTEQALSAGSAQSLSGTIMSTLRLAVADAARRQAEIVQRYVGDRLNIADRVMATQRELLGDRIAAGDEERRRLGAGPGSAGGADYDDDPDTGFVLHDDARPARPEIPRTGPAGSADEFLRLYGGED